MMDRSKETMSRDADMDDDDRFVRDYDQSDLEIAAEFLRNWLPFLTRDLCHGCSANLRRRIHSLHPQPQPATMTPETPNFDDDDGEAMADDLSVSRSVVSGELPSSSYEGIEPIGWDDLPPPPPLLLDSPRVRMSWADMAQEEDQLEEEEEDVGEEEENEEEVDEKAAAARGEMNPQPSVTKAANFDKEKKKTELSREQREMIRFFNVGRKKDFICLQRVHGRLVNIVDGLELHTGVFSAAEQKRIIDFVYHLQDKGRNHEFEEHTYSEPPKWMRGKGPVAIQFGCCYNFAKDKEGNPPGILKTVVPDPIPHLFKVIIRRLVRWHVLPPTCIPDSCIVNIYEPGDCIPPHVDSHDFVRPFCTVSFLSECNIIFGSNIKIAGPGEFTGLMTIPLPVGSVLVLNGNGADMAKHCVPAVPTKRISITFRRLAKSKWPISFKPEVDLQNIQPLVYNNAMIELPHHDSDEQEGVEGKSSRKGKQIKGRRSKSKPSPNFQESRNLSRDPMLDSVGPPQGNVDSPTSTSNSLNQGVDSDRRAVESESRPRLRNRNYYQDDSGMNNRLSHDVRYDEEGGSSNIKGGRRVRLEQHRMIISRNLEGQGDKVPWRKPGFEINQISGTQSANNWRRRVRMNWSDGS